MFLDKKYKVEAVCDPKDYITHLRTPHLYREFPHIKGPAVVSANQFSMAIVPVTIDPHEDTDGPLSIPALKHSRKRGNDGALSANGALRTLDGTQFPRPENDNPIPVESLSQVIPDDEPGRYRVGINPSALLNIAKAIGSGEFVELSFAVREDGSIDPTKAILVNCDGDSFGVLMPKNSGR